jgi:capsular exopolysaccharide synthesis family protein
VSLGLVLALTTATLIWFLFPAKYTASALIQISANERRVLTDRADPGNNGMDVAMFHRTQAALIKSHRIVSVAVTSKSPVDRFVVKKGQTLLESLDMLKQQDDPMHWLERNLKSGFLEGTDLLQLSLSGYEQQTRQLADTVNAVTDAYLTETTNAEHRAMVSKLDDLQRALTDHETKQRKQKDNLLALIQTLGTSDSQTLNHRQRLQLEKYAAFERELHGLQVKQQSVESKLQGQKDTESQLSRWNAPVPEHLVTEAVENSPAIQKQQGEIQAAVQMLTYLDIMGAPAGTRAAAERNLDAAKTTLDTLRTNGRRDAKERIRQKRAEEAQIKRKEIEQEVENGREQIRRLAEEVGKLERVVESLGIRSTELDMQKSVIDETEQVLRTIRQEMDRLRIELESTKQRVHVWQDSEVPQVKDVLIQALRSALAGVGAFVLAVCAVTFWEYRSGRIITTDQVAKELRLKILGILPNLSKSPPRIEGPGGSQQSLSSSVLIESVDGIRAMLLAEADGIQSRILMVSSATSREGKTMLASHLATSIARTGRRTLLIDCDLRRPSLHQLFEVGPTPGLSEVLRGEAELAEAVQPIGELSGLFLLAAGRSDRRAIHALAREDLAAVFAKLRLEFDFVIMDSCPILPVADSLLVSRHVDGVLLCVRPTISQTRNVTAAIERLQGVGVRMLGTVVNGDLRYANTVEYYYPDAATST